MDKLHEAPLVISGQWQWLILCRLMHSRDAIESSLTFMSIGIHASERGAHLKRVNYDYTASVLSSRLLPETCSLLFPLWPSPERWSDTPRISQPGRRSQNLRTQIFAVLMGGTGARYWRGVSSSQFKNCTHLFLPYRVKPWSNVVPMLLCLLYWTHH